jgi:hypothetical protein
VHIPGHLAVAWLEQRFLLSPSQRQAVRPPLFIASLFPDAVDKSIGYIFAWMPNGRHYTHNLFSLIFLSLAVGALWGKMAGYGWFLGHSGHLLADANSLVPWFFPLKKYPFKQGHLTFKPPQIIRESIFLGIVLLIDRFYRQI